MLHIDYMHAGGILCYIIYPSVFSLSFLVYKVHNIFTHMLCISFPSASQRRSPHTFPRQRFHSASSHPHVVSAVIYRKANAQLPARRANICCCHATMPICLMYKKIHPPYFRIQDEMRCDDMRCPASPCENGSSPRCYFTPLCWSVSSIWRTTSGFAFADAADGSVTPGFLLVPARFEGFPFTSPLARAAVVP